LAFKGLVAHVRAVKYTHTHTHTHTHTRTMRTSPQHGRGRLISYD